MATARTAPRATRVYEVLPGLRMWVTVRRGEADRYLQLLLGSHNVYACLDRAGALEVLRSMGKK